MPHLDFDDTPAVAHAIAAAGAPKAAAHYPCFPRSLNAILSELRSLQGDRLATFDRRLVRRSDLVRRAADAKFANEKKVVSEQLAVHDAGTQRLMSDFAARTADGQAKLDTIGRCALVVQEFVRTTVGQARRLRDVPLPSVAVLPGGLASTIEAKRAELVVTAERRADIESRPAKPSDLKAAISRELAARASKGRPPFSSRIRGGKDPSKLALMLMLGSQPGATGTNMIGDGGTDFFVWLLSDQIEARLHALVDEADLTGAMSDAEQIAALTTIDAERLVLEREEEALIRMAEAQGMTIARRGDVSPMAVLMVEVLE